MKPENFTMDTLTWITILVASISLALYWHITRKYRYWSDRGIPGPEPKPFMGNMLTIATESSPKYEMKWAQDYGKMYGTYIGFAPTLTIMDIELIKQVMVKDFHLFVNHRKFNYYHEEFSQNLFSLADDRWKVVRSIVTPTFSSGKLRGMNSLTNRSVDKLIGHLNQLTSGQSTPVSINPRMVIITFTLNVIVSTAFGTEINAVDESGDQTFSKQTNPVQYYASKLFFLSWFHTLSMFAFPRWINDLLNIRMDADLESYNFFASFLKNILAQRKTNPTQLKRNDLVQLLLDAAIDENELAKTDYSQLASNVGMEESFNDVNKKSSEKQQPQRKLTEHEIVAQCLMFFSAGFETTATTISYVLYELATNPDVQDRLVEELDAKLNDIPESKRNSDEFYDKVINEIPYLDAIVKETLRKYPPVARVERRVSIDGYKLGPVELYKDQLVEVPVYALHHSEEYYPEPERFHPDRFMPENKDRLVPYTYLPFGTGPRNCVGMRFAYQVAKLCLAQIVPRFRFVPTPETPIPLEFLKGSFILCPESMPIAVSRR